MHDIEAQVRRLQRLFRNLAWIVAVGALFDGWEIVRLVRVVRAWWGQPWRFQPSDLWPKA